MLTTHFKCPWTVEKYCSLISGSYLADFIAWLESQGYRRITIERLVQGVGNFARWAKTQGLTIEKFDRIALAKLHCYLAKRKTLRYPSGDYNCVYRSARIFVSFLEARGVVGLDVHYPTQPVPILLQEFNEWMRTQRGTLDSTLANYRLPITKLLQNLGADPKAFTAKDLREFLLQELKEISPGKTKNLTKALRMFLRFLIARGDCAVGLEHAIPTVARWHLSALPKYLPANDVECLIKSCDQAQPLGARDRSMLLLIARLGLRAGEVRALKFGDIDWSEGTLMVAGKNRRQSRLPLPQEVGESILHYLKHARPNVVSEHIFITTLAPFGPIPRQVVGSAVVRALRRTGVSAPSQGSHLLRHSMATSMLHDGISLHAIGALLRHASIDTTTVYAKVDFALLAEVAMPWPEVQSC